LAVGVGLGLGVVLHGDLAGCGGGRTSAASAAAAAEDEAGKAPNAVPSRTRSRSSWWKSAQSVLRPRTSQDRRCGSYPPPAPATAAASASPPRPQEKDLLRRRSGSAAAPDPEGPPAAAAAAAAELKGREKSERMAEVDLRPGAAAVAAEASSPARRSRRQAAQKPVKVSSGWRSHVVDTDRRGGGTGGSICSTIYLGRPRTAG